MYGSGARSMKCAGINYVGQTGPSGTRGSKADGCGWVYCTPVFHSELFLVRQTTNGHAHSRHIWSVVSPVSTNGLLHFHADYVVSTNKRGSTTRRYRQSFLTRSPSGRGDEYAPFREQESIVLDWVTKSPNALAKQFSFPNTKRTEKKRLRKQQVAVVACEAVLQLDQRVSSIDAAPIPPCRFSDGLQAYCARFSL